MLKLTDDKTAIILETKKTIKGLSELQKREKAILRTPHYNIKIIEKDGIAKGVDRVVTAGTLQWRTLERAGKITELLIEYNKMRGKPWDMHAKKKK